MERNIILEEDQGEDEGDGVYFARVSPETVKAIAAALRDFPRWKMMDRLRKASPLWVRHKQGRDKFSRAFDELGSGLRRCCRSGAALEVLIC